MRRKKATNIVRGRYARRPAEALLAALQPTVLVSTHRVPLTSFPSGASRLGGSPDLPSDIEWPHVGQRALSFVAQLDLTRLGEPIGGVPGHGWFCFFIDDKADPPAPGEPDERGRVLWFHAGSRSLTLATADGRMRRSRWHASTADMHDAWSLPALDEAGLEAVGLPGDAPTLAGYQGLRQRLRAGAPTDAPLHQIGGHPNRPGAAQGDAHVLLLQLVADDDGPGWDGLPAGVGFQVPRDGLAACRAAIGAASILLVARLLHVSG